jgi:hypothetical protein
MIQRDDGDGEESEGVVSCYIVGTATRDRTIAHGVKASESLVVTEVFR